MSILLDSFANFCCVEMIKKDSSFIEKGATRHGWLDDKTVKIVLLVCDHVVVFMYVYTCRYTGKHRKSRNFNTFILTSSVTLKQSEIIPKLLLFFVYRGKYKTPVLSSRYLSDKSVREALSLLESSFSFQLPLHSK